MQRFHILEPGESDVIIRKGAFDRDADLVVAVTLERPIAQRRKAFNSIDRMLEALIRRINQWHHGLGTAHIQPPLLAGNCWFRRCARRWPDTPESSPKLVKTNLTFRRSNFGRDGSRGIRE